MSDNITGAPGAPAGPGASATPAGDGVSSGTVAVDAAVATASGEAQAAAASESASTAAQESATSESSPSLLSSATGKTPTKESPDQPAPAAEPSKDAKPADGAVKDGSPDGKKPEDPAKAEPGKADAKDPAATDPATKDATPAAAPALLSVDDLKLPEGASLDGEAGKAFVDLLNNAELAGKDRGQGLLDLHQKEIARVHGEMVQHQRKVWSDLNDGWKDQLRKDPELGGNRLNTSLSMAKAVVEEFLSPEDAVALLKHTDLNGMGNFPPFVRLLHTLGKKLNVFEDGVVTANPKAPRAKSPGNRGWYDSPPSQP